MFFPTYTSLFLGIALAALLAVGTLPVLVQCLGMFFAVSRESVSRPVGSFQLPLTCFAAWAPVSLWVALDSYRLCRVPGRPVDSWVPPALWGAILGDLNVGAFLLVVMSRASR